MPSDELKTILDQVEFGSNRPPSKAKLNEMVGVNPDREEKIKKLENERDRFIRKKEDNILRHSENIASVFDRMGFPVLPAEEYEAEEMAHLLQEFLETNAATLMPRLKAGEKIKVNPSYMNIFVEEKVGSKTLTELVRVEINGTSAIDQIKYLTLSNVDLKQLKLEQLEKFATETQESFKAVFEDSAEIHYKQSETRGSIEKLYAEEMAVIFQQLCDQALTFSTDERPHAIEDLVKSLELLEEVKYSLGKEFGRFVQIFADMIARKREISPQNERAIDDALEQNTELIEKLMWSDLVEQLAEADRRADYESLYRKVFGLSPTEIARRRKRNWDEIAILIKELGLKGEPMSVDQLRNITIINARGILPSAYALFRHDSTDFSYINSRGLMSYERQAVIKKEAGNVSTTEATSLEQALQNLVDDTNKLIDRKLPNTLFEILMGEMFARYCAIHPGYDGNGTMAVFYVELSMVLSGRKPTDSFATRYIPKMIGITPTTYRDSRVTQAFRYNPLALLNVAKNLLKYESSNLSVD